MMLFIANKNGLALCEGCQNEVHLVPGMNKRNFWVLAGSYLSIGSHSWWVKSVIGKNYAFECRGELKFMSCAPSALWMSKVNKVLFENESLFGQSAGLVKM